MNKKDRKSILETLEFCQTFISKSIIEVLEEVKASDSKVTDEIAQKHHNLLKHRYNLDQIAEELK